MKIFSFGGGVQSMAALVLSARGDLGYTHFIFANVGDDSENPQTIEYVRDIAVPYARTRGLEIIPVKRETKPGKPATLLQQTIGPNKIVPIPMYINRKPARRICTSDWKINVVNKWMRKHAGAAKTNRVHVGVGISMDEVHRMRTDDPERYPYTIMEYPLIDLRMTRSDCEKIIADEGLPMAPKSSCWFCPFTKLQEWQSMRADRPELFARAIELESIVAAKLPQYTSVTLHRGTAALPEAVPAMASPDDAGADMDFCESGYCMT